MTSEIRPSSVARGPRRRHDARVERYSKDRDLLVALDRLAVDDAQATALVMVVCDRLEVAPPILKFHARRSMYTGATEPPRDHLVDLFGEARVRSHEAAKRRQIPADGVLRLGRRVTLMTLAHELGHHLVNVHDPVRTPAHGKRWIGWFDASAEIIAAQVGVPGRS